ncbi:MAG: ATP-binding protein [Lachnospiraceae bacterium]|nr:ATP-binding protein [Lachnospiraceae bacterium]
MSTNELIVYRDLMSDPLISDMSLLFTEGADRNTKLHALFYECVRKLLDFAGHYGFGGNLWHVYIAHLLVNCENTYSRAEELKGAVDGSVCNAVDYDMAIIKDLFNADLEELASKFGFKEPELITSYRTSEEESKVYNSRIRSRIMELTKRLEEGKTAEAFRESLRDFYREYGVGRFGLHKAFRIEEAGGQSAIVPITNITHVRFDDLVGYESQKQKIRDNTEAFLNGLPANNCLLFGDAGTGKSSCIKAIANEYFDRGLRIIEIYKHQFKDINAVISTIKSRNYRFILYMDDLSFENFETDYKYLKAVIEGGLERKPKNVLIYATSNRRHLVDERFSEREATDQVHARDNTEEKLSLYERFGVTVYFGGPSKDEFEDIVLNLAERKGLSIPKETLLTEANKWQLSHGSRSGRLAEQFVNHLLGIDGLKEGKQ